MKNQLWFASAAFALSAFATSTFGAQTSLSPKLTPWVAKQMNQETHVPVMVFLKTKADLSGASILKTKREKGAFVYKALRDVALESQKGLVALLTNKKFDFDRYYVVNMIAIYDATADLVKELEARDDVAKIMGNPKFQVYPEAPLTASVDVHIRGIEDAIKSTGADRVWNDFQDRGENIVVAGQDTGVDWDHPALKEKYRGYNGTSVSHDYNWYDAARRNVSGTDNPCGLAIAEPCDDHGHGTHTVGTMVGDDGKGNQIGMAPNAKWIACRNMDNGVGRPTTYIKCFEFFLAPFPSKGNALTDGRPDLAPHVINNSWGCPKYEGCTGTEMVDVLKALKAAGIVTVVSAGNDGPYCSTISTQGATLSETTLSVGAVNHRTGDIAYFSSRGPSTFDAAVGPDVSAPGVSIRSSIPGGGYEGGWSGTSMAGPHVAGEVALVLSAQPKLIGNVQAVFDLISVATTPKTASETCGNVPGKQIPNNTYGNGIIDAYKAVQTAKDMKFN